MSAEPIAPPSREMLEKLSRLLLEQHKLLLDRERAAYEKAHGPVPNPRHLLALLLNDAHFAWLREISTLIVDIDEALSRRSKAGQDVADALTERARQLMRPREAGSDFQMRYYQAIQESPDVVILQCKMERLLE